MRFHTTLSLWLLGGILTLTLLGPASRPAPPDFPGAPPRDPRFGWVEAYQVPEIASRSRVAWQRVRFHWGEIQPTGPDDWQLTEITESQIDAEVAAEREIVGLLIGLPDWAASNNRLPAGLYLSEDDPANTWAVFVRTIVGRYAGRVDRWIIWNEPDVWDKNHPGHTWDGDERDFVRLLQVAYRVAKATNPNAQIHLPGLSHYWDTNFGRDIYLRRLLNTIDAVEPNAAAENYYFDVATLHLYFNIPANDQLLRDYIGLLRSRGLNQPLWLVETNAPPSVDPAYPVANPTFAVSLSEQAAYLPQIMAISLAAGVERVAIYTASDPREGADPEPFGLIRADGSPRPAVRTYHVAARYLAGAATAERVDHGDHIAVTLTQPDRTTTLYWTYSTTPLALTLTVPPEVSAVLLVSADGKTRWAEIGRDRTLNLTLPAAECNHLPCMIGGLPVYVVYFDHNDCLFNWRFRGVVLC